MATVEFDFSGRLHSAEIKRIIADICVAGRDSVLDSVMDTVLSSPDSQEANNAAWVLTNFPRSKRDALSERRNALAGRLLSASDDTMRRLLTTLLSNLDWDEDDFMGDLFDFCLANITDRRVPLGIRARSIYLANRMSTPVPELRRELSLALDILSGDELPPALRSAVRHVSPRRD